MNSISKLGKKIKKHPNKKVTCDKPKHHHEHGQEHYHEEEEEYNHEHEQEKEHHHEHQHHHEHEQLHEHQHEQDQPLSTTPGSHMVKYSDPIITQDQTKVHTARAIVLSCMDFRLLDDIVFFMNSKGYNNNYDQFILAGASLSVNLEDMEEFKHSAPSFFQHLKLAIELHKIEEVIIIDHFQCGAYNKVYGKLNEETERDKHIENIHKLENRIKEAHPKLQIISYIMRIDGTCEKVLRSSEKTSGHNDQTTEQHEKISGYSVNFAGFHENHHESCSKC